MLVLTLLTILSLLGLRHQWSKRLEIQNSYNASQDTIKFYKNKDGENVARITVLSFERVQDFIRMRTKDDTIRQLQDLVAKYKKQLNNGGSATIIQTVTNYDTTYVSNIHLDTIYFPTATLLDSVRNRWISSRFGFVNGNTTFSISIDNAYSVVIGEENRGLFKKSKAFVEVTNHNPYTKTKVLRTYQVSEKKQTHWGIGPNFSVSAIPVLIGGNVSLQFLPTVGIGIQYNFIKF